MSKLTDRIRVVAFDLDGTLVDSLADLAGALNLMLKTLDAPAVPETRVRAMVGNGVDQLVVRGLTESLGAPPSHPAQQSAALALYRRIYSQSLFRHSKVFPGVVEGLQALADAGATLCCVTNKDSEFTLPILEQAGIAKFFAFTLCGDRREDRKPNPTMLLAACSRCGVTPTEMLYVGDSSIDIAAARAAGCPIAIVDYGHTSQAIAGTSAQPDAVIGSFTELLNLRLSADPPRDVTNVIRALAMDAVQKANSGHPGMPMGMAEIAEVLWRRHLRHNPADPQWPDRDRFVISNGHGSMLLYSLLHLTGYDLPMEQLQQFRQMGSRTPGHPEYGVTPGAETTTGPLGQGISNAVGMAIAQKLLAEEFNRPGFELFCHYTYVFLGDGCLMEGISHEACSLAGTLGLGKLVVFYDDNGISIDGHVKGWFTDDTPKRFDAYGWHVVPNVDGHDSQAVDRAIVAAKAAHDRPSLICCKTIIGKGAPTKAGTHDSHGAPLGEKEIAAARAELGWQHPPFVVPPHVYDAWDAREAGAVAQSDWNTKFAQYARAYPDQARELQRRLQGDLPEDFGATVQHLIAKLREKAQSIASRKASQDVIEALAPNLPELIGGSADLAGSNLTLWSGSRAVTAKAPGNYIHYGVREFGMAAVMNGIALHGGFIPYGGTFLTFADYCRNALRMAALMRVRCIFVFTHDSIGLGEDGPTHQPVEHLACLRLIPNMDVWRPCDTEESAVAWAAALERRDGPSCLIFSRQNLPFQKRSAAVGANVARGGYVLRDPAGGALPRAVLIATGSEVGLAVDAHGLLSEAGIPVRVVSMPSTSLFDRQSREYQDSVLPPGLPCVAIEAGSTDLWRKYVGKSGEVVGMGTFGESAPAAELFKHFGFTASKVIEAVKQALHRSGVSSA